MKKQLNNSHLSYDLALEKQHLRPCEEPISALLKEQLQMVRAKVSQELSGFYEKQVNERETEVFAKVLQDICDNPGKMYRALLLYFAGRACGVTEEVLFKVGAALEMLHTYSLVHDDLPSMDNSSTRRGRASAHILYGEDVAILAGDALLTDAFFLLTDENFSKNGVKGATAAAVVREVSRYLGSRGMVLGQVLDLSFTNPAIGTTKQISDIDRIHTVHKLKTANFFSLACKLGGILGEASKEHVDALERFGLHLGLAYQIKDDVEDHTSAGAQQVAEHSTSTFEKQTEETNICDYMCKQEATVLLEQHLKSAKAELKDFKEPFKNLLHILDIMQK